MKRVTPKNPRKAVRVTKPPCTTSDKYMRAMMRKTRKGR